VHKAKMGLLGYYGDDDFTKMIEEITVINNSIVNGYALKTGKSPEEITAIMAAETWYDGKQAVEAGFCDKLMFEEVETTVENASKVVVNSIALDLSRFPDMPVSLLNRCTAHTHSGFSNISTQTTTEKERKNMPENKEIKTVDELKAAYPDLTAQIAKDATAAERKRISDIEDVALAGFENIVNDAKFTNPIAAGDVAKAIVAEQKKQGATYIANRDDDAKNSGAGKEGAGAQHEGAAGKDGASDFDAAIDKLYPTAK